MSDDDNSLVRLLLALGLIALVGYGSYRVLRSVGRYHREQVIRREELRRLEYARQQEEERLAEEEARQEEAEERHQEWLDYLQEAEDEGHDICWDCAQGGQYNNALDPERCNEGHCQNCSGHCPYCGQCGDCTGCGNSECNSCYDPYDDDDD